MKRTLLNGLGAITVAIMAFTLLGTSPALAKAAILQPGDEYVALGDSFASGSGIAPLSDVFCARSASDYPQQVAQQLNLTLTDVTCGGATIDNLLNTPEFGVIPPQINAVTPTTKLVTITIGSNDGNYTLNSIRMSCAHDPTVVATAPNLPPFLQQLFCGPVDRQTSIQTLSSLDTKLVQLVEAVRLIAPNARIVLTDYITVLPESGNPCPAVVMTKDEIKFGSEMARVLSLSIKHAAQESGAEYVPLSKISKNHDACSSTPWANGYVFADFLQYGLTVYHPNAAGQTASANEIENALLH